MMPFYYISPVAMVVFAIFFYRAALFDGCPVIVGLSWAALSVAISFFVLQWLRWGLLAMIPGQIGLFVGIGVFRVIRKA